MSSRDFQLSDDALFSVILSQDDGEYGSQEIRKSIFEVSFK